MVVRFEVDACLPFRPASPHRKPRRPRNGTCRVKRIPPPPPSAPPINEPVHVAIIRAGSPVPQSHLIELKTYSKSKKQWSRSYPQLFLSQTPHIYYGAHKDGTFSEIKKYTLGEPHLEAIDQNAQAGFRKLKTVLTAVQELVRKYGTNGRISLVCRGRVLEVYQRENTGSCLPKYALALFKP